MKANMRTTKSGSRSGHLKYLLWNMDPPKSHVSIVARWPHLHNGRSCHGGSKERFVRHDSESELPEEEPDAIRYLCEFAGHILLAIIKLN